MNLPRVLVTLGLSCLVGCTAVTREPTAFARPPLLLPAPSTVEAFQLRLLHHHQAGRRECVRALIRDFPEPAFALFLASTDPGTRAALAELWPDGRERGALQASLAAASRQPERHRLARTRLEAGELEEALAVFFAVGDPVFANEARLRAGSPLTEAALRLQRARLLSQAAEAGRVPLLEALRGAVEARAIGALATCVTSLTSFAVAADSPQDYLAAARLALQCDETLLAMQGAYRAEGVEGSEPARVLIQCQLVGGNPAAALASAAAAAESARSDAERAAFLALEADALFRLGHHEAAGRIYRQAAQCCAAAGDPAGELRAGLNAAMAALRLGEIATAQAELEELEGAPSLPQELHLYAQVLRALAGWTPEEGAASARAVASAVELAASLGLYAFVERWEHLEGRLRR